MSLLWLVVCAAACAGAGAARRPLGARAAFELESTVFVNDVAQHDRELGYKVLARLQLQPVFADQHSELLLHFRLLQPKLHLRGKHINAEFMPYESLWDEYPDTTFYAHWNNGIIQSVYLDPSEPVDVLNYKKAVVSLFQFQELDGEYNETDVSGPCQVLYETISQNVFRKIKRRCEVDDNGAVAGARRVARYSLGAGGALDALYADELLAVGDERLGLKARAWQRLSSSPHPPAAQPQHPSLQAALQALPPALAAHSLALTPAPAPAPQELNTLLEEYRELLEKGEEPSEGGAERVEAALAFAALRLLPALRAASSQQLLQALQRPEHHRALPALCRLLGLAATRAAHSAADDFLQLHARDALEPLAHAYLGALALAPAPDEAVLREALRLGREGKAPAVADAALLAAAAAARRPADSAAARDALAAGLARCRDERCRAVRLRALGNLARNDTADALLEHAGRAALAGEARAALAALDALRAAPPAALTFARLERLTELALEERAALEVRAAALDLLVERRARVPLPLARVAVRLNERGPRELRRVFWARLAALAPRHERVRELLASLHPRLTGWDGQAHGGSSSLLERDCGWAAGGWGALLESVQVARAGLLRRGTVRLLARHSDGREFDALTVEVWTRGLEAFGGGAGGEAEEGEAEEAAGGLAVGAGGARARDVSLFAGQAELLSHVWAGTASSPTPALRALLPLGEHAAHVPLAGGAVLRAGWRAAGALALDAQAQVSLWHRNARALLELRAAAVSEARASLAPAWGAVEARARAEAEPRLLIAADLDFYEGSALCVRVRADDHEYARNVTLESRQGERRLFVRRTALSRLPAPGRTLALGRPNDRTCRTLRSHDD